MSKPETAVAGRPPPLPSPTAAGGRHSQVLHFFFDALMALAMMLAAGLAGGILWGAARGFALAMRDGTFGVAQIGQPGPLALLCIASAGTMTAALLLYVWRRRAPAVERLASLRQARRPATWGWAIAAGAATFAWSIAIGALVARGGGHVTPTNVPIIAGVAEQHLPTLMFFAVIMAPVSEEILFRRVLFGRLWAAGHPLLGAILSAALFALLHELPGQGGNSLAGTALLWLQYGAMGLAFAWVYRRTGTLWAAIGAHATNNLFAMLVLLAQRF